MILPINHVADWRYIWHLKQAQINKDVINENTSRIDHNYRVVDNVMIKTKSAYKYRTSFKVPYENFYTCRNKTVTLRMRAVTNRINICDIKPYNNPNVEWCGPLITRHKRSEERRVW